MAAGKGKISNIKKNAISSVANTLVLALAGFFLNPLFVGLLGPSYFGFWKSAQRYLELGASLDGGSVQSLKWTIANAAGSGDSAKRLLVIKFTRLLLFWLPFMAISIVVIIATLPTLVSDSSLLDSRELLLIGVFLGINVIMTVVASIPDSVLVGMNEGYRSTWITTCAFAITNGVLAVSCLLGSSVSFLCFVMVVGTLINGGITYRTAKNRFKWLSTSSGSLASKHSSIKISTPLFVWALVNRLIASSELLLIAYLVSSAEVASFTFTTFVLQFALAICQLATSAMTPKLGATLSSGKVDVAHRMLIEMRQLNLFLASTFTLGYLIFNEWFVKMWAGESFFLGNEFNLWMSLSFFQLALLRVDAQIQDTTLKIRAKAILGGISIMASLFGGVVGYGMTGKTIGIIFGVIVGRMVMSIGFPILVKATTKTIAWPVYRLLGLIPIFFSWIAVSKFVQDAGFLAMSLMFCALSCIVFFVTMDATSRSKILRMK
jgi:O-antigen/teichoic acid export membrane protein